MKFRWLPHALQDVEHLYDFLVEKDPGTAALAIEIILDGAEGLVDMPKIGRLMDDDTGRRDLFLP